MSIREGKYILAIDLGTSGPKVGLVSVDGEIVAGEFEETPLLLLPNGGAEQKPDDWWAAITKAARKVIGQNTVPVGDIVAVSCTSQYSSTVAVNRDGQPLMNAINWMDTRGARYVQQITSGPIKIEGYGIDKLWTWVRLTGGIPTRSGKDSIAHILYLKHEQPEIYREAYKFLEPKDYINLRLTGKFAATYDSINLHWLTDNRNIANIVYDDRLLKMAGVDRGKLPELKHATDILGPLTPEAAAELGLPVSAPVVAGTTDAQSAAIGSGAVKDYEAHLYLGTSSWISCYVPFKKTDIVHNMASLPSAIPGRYYIANEQECAGMCLTFLRDNLVYPADELAVGARPAEAYKLFYRIAEHAPAGSEGLIFTPWLYGERTPIEDGAVRGGFFNLSLKTKRESLVRAVFEGVAYNARWLLGCVEQFAKRRFESLNMIGGGAKSNVWCRIHADILDRTIRQVKDPLQANTRGAALVASVALGYATFDDIAAGVEIANTYHPNPANRKIYDELFKEFLNIYQSNKRIYARLNRAG
ncbi:MAG: FGGY-family carbohydrate kinase, partial [Chloroflexota bacterium]